MRKYVLRFFILLLLGGWTIHADEELNVTMVYHQNTTSEDTTTSTQTFQGRLESYRLAPQPFHNEGHILAGYNTKPDGSGDYYIPRSYMAYFDLVDHMPEFHLYAQWWPMDSTYGGVIFIGDSYSIHANWADYAAKEIGLSGYLISDLGGTGFVNEIWEQPKDKPTNFEVLLEDAAILAGEESNRAQYHYIVVEGGYNDQYYEEERVIEAISSFVQKARELFPNARIVVGMNGEHTTNPDVQLMMKNVTLTYKKACEQNGIAYLEGIETVLEQNPEYFSEDGFHPNQAGGAKIGAYTAAYLKHMQQDTTMPTTPISTQTKGMMGGWVFLPIGMLLAGGLLYLKHRKRSAL